MELVGAAASFEAFLADEHGAGATRTSYDGSFHASHIVFAACFDSQRPLGPHPEKHKRISHSAKRLVRRNMDTRLASDEVHL